MLEEWSDTGTISVRSFYARRAIRLLPALAVMLLTVVIVSSLVEPPWRAADFRVSALMTFFYVANWFSVTRKFPSPDLAHTWSLSVEEQFYIVWPIILYILLRAKGTRAALVGFVIASILAVAAYRSFLWTTSGSWVRVYFGSDAHADGLLSGALVALLMSWGLIPRSRAMVWGLNATAVGAMGLIPMFVTRVQPYDGWLYDGGYLGVNLAVATLVMSTVASPWAPLRLLFESAPMCWIGRVSYGIYLWHLPAFWWVRRSGWPQGWWAMVAAVILTLAIAAVSFYALERPLLKLKRRFERVGSARLSS